MEGDGQHTERGTAVQGNSHGNLRASGARAQAHPECHSHHGGSLAEGSTARLQGAKPGLSGAPLPPAAAGYVRPSGGPLSLSLNFLF